MNTIDEWGMWVRFGINMLLRVSVRLVHELNPDDVSLAGGMAFDRVAQAHAMKVPSRKLASANKCICSLPAGTAERSLIGIQGWLSSTF